MAQIVIIITKNYMATVMKRVEFSPVFWEILYAMNQDKVTLALRGDIFVTPKWIDYISLDSQNPEMISYITEERLSRAIATGYDKWDIKYRYGIKPAAFIEKLFPNTFTDKDKEIFTVGFRAEILRKFPKPEDLVRIVHVEGEDIRNYYHRRTYQDDDCGSLGSSCMKHDDCQKYFDIYVENKDKIGMAIVFNEYGELIARCICWYPEGKGKGKPKYNDRIYCSSDTIGRNMQITLEKHGYINIYNGNPVKTLEFEKSLVIQLEKWVFNYYPYVDTMTYMNIQKGTLHNHSSRGHISLGSTGGGPKLDYCNSCKKINQFSNLREVVRGSAKGTYACQECVVYSYEYVGAILLSEAIHTDYDEWVLAEDVIILRDGKTVSKWKAVRLYDDTWMHVSEPFKTSKEGQRFIPGDENFELIGTGWYKIGSVSYNEKKKQQQIKEHELL
jgi:hypothetical protein